jgi:hypothetical protein
MKIEREIQRLDLSWEMLLRDYSHTEGEIALTYLKLLALERSDFLRHFDHYERFGEFSHPEIQGIKNLLERCQERLTDYQQKLEMINKDQKIERKNQNKNKGGKYNTQENNNYDETWACMLLGVKVSDSDEEIKRAYLAKIKRNHPDKISGKDLDEEFIALAEQRTQEINRAWLVIRNSRNIK